MKKSEWQILQDSIKEWDTKTFGKRSLKQASKPFMIHLSEEAKELEQALKLFIEKKDTFTNVCFELSDALLLILNISSHLDIDIENLLSYCQLKHEINRSREWERDNNGVFHHKK